MSRWKDCVDFFGLIIVAARRYYAHLKGVFSGCKFQIRHLVHFQCAKDRMSLVIAMQLLVKDKIVVNPK